MDENYQFLVPGDVVDRSSIPINSKKMLRIGPGLRHLPPDCLCATIAGRVYASKKKNTIWMESNGGRYYPSLNDLVIGQVIRSAGDYYFVNIAPYSTNAVLPVLSFEAVTKKTRPQLQPGALVYARVTLANKYMDVELECVNENTGKADGLGPLEDGMMFDVSQGLARRLSMAKSKESQAVLLEELGNAGIEFEVAVGRNGRVWVRAEKPADVILVGRALRETDEEDLTASAQKVLVKRLLKEREQRRT